METAPLEVELDRSQVRPEESWAEAADRVVAAEGGSAAGPLLAVDLSGDPLSFGLDRGRRFAFRAMTEADLADLVRWVNLPHVARRLIFVTGDVAGTDAERFLAESGCRWIPKPFRLRDLVRVARETLG